MKRAKLSERMTPMLWASLFQRQTDAIAAPTRPDQAEPGNRHPLARLPERLREHGGDRRQRDDDERDDGEVFAH